MEQSGADADAPAAKRQRAEEGAGAAPADERETNEPRTFVALNVNGLASRMLASEKASGEEQANSAAHAAAFVTHLFGVAGGPPDVICLTEVRARCGAIRARYVAAASRVGVFCLCADVANGRRSISEPRAPRSAASLSRCRPRA